MRSQINLEWIALDLASDRAEQRQADSTVVDRRRQNQGGAPPGLPFKFDDKTIANGLNFTLTTDFGSLDLLGEIACGGYEQLLPHSIRIPIFGIECWLLGLERLIQSKRAAGRPKDFEAIAELERILEQESQ